MGMKPEIKNGLESQKTLQRIRSYLRKLPSLSANASLRRSFLRWLNSVGKAWIELSEICFGMLQGTRRELLGPFLASWMILFVLSGWWDNKMDGDKSPQQDDDLSMNQSFLFVSAIIADVFSNLVKSGEPGLVEAGAVLMEGFRNACLGQAQDLGGVKTLDEYEEMLDLKAGPLVSSLLEAISILSDSDEKSRNLMKQFGHELGIAVQTVNDYLGTWRPENVGKVAGGDLNQAQLTYPVLFGLGADGPEANAFRSLASAAPGQRDTARMLDLLDELGGREFMAMMLEMAKSRVVRIVQEVAKDDDLKILAVWFETRIIGRISPV